jgi:hypothetical protein
MKRKEKKRCDNLKRLQHSTIICFVCVYRSLVGDMDIQWNMSINFGKGLDQKRSLTINEQTL